MTNFKRDFAETGTKNKIYKKNLRQAIFAMIMLLVFMAIAGTMEKSHASTNININYANTADQTIEPRYSCYVWNGAYCVKMADHTNAFWNCSKYYELPCGEDGELLTSIPYDWALEIWEGEENGDVNLSVFEMNYLINHIGK